MSKLDTSSTNPMDSKKRYRIMWKSNMTGRTGSGPYLTEEESREMACIANEEFSGVIIHWVEVEPE